MASYHRHWNYPSLQPELAVQLRLHSPRGQRARSLARRSLLQHELFAQDSVVEVVQKKMPLRLFQLRLMLRRLHPPRPVQPLMLRRRPPKIR